MLQPDSPAAMRCAGQHTREISCGCLEWYGGQDRKSRAKNKAGKRTRTARTATTEGRDRAMIIRNTCVFGPDRKFHEHQDVVIRGGVFARAGQAAGRMGKGASSFVPAVGDSAVQADLAEPAGREAVPYGTAFAETGVAAEVGEEIVDGSGCYAIPGLIDIHFHGAMNADVCDGERQAYEVIAAYEAREGITAICPATLTLSVEELKHVLAVGADFAETPHAGSDLIGFNMEGPFISHVKKGAQNEAYILPCSAAVADEFLDASDGLVKIIGLAPEENPDFEEYIRAVKGRVTVSLAHTNADYETAMRAFSAGASHAVHLFNAMTGLGHREPGVVGAVSDSPHVNAEIICDGIHIHPAAVRAAFRLNGKERMVFISDSLRCTGMPDGEYELGGQPVVKQGKFCRLKEGGNLAGSVTNLADCMRNAVKTMGIPLEDAVACATINPARAIHEEARYGSIEPGKKGHVVLLRRDENLTPEHVIMNGTVIR